MSSGFRKAVIGKSRSTSGDWSVLGILHGGEEGREWQKGKGIVKKTRANITATAHNKRMSAMSRIEKLKISEGDKNRLIGDLNSKV